jgi:hypothetical protein
MAKKDKGRMTADPVSYQIPDPAGSVRIETFIPWTLVKRGVKREVITPLDAPEVFQEEANRERRQSETEEDSALVRALGLAHYWQQLLQESKADSFADIAVAENLDKAHVSRILRLAFLAPEIIEAYVSGQSGEGALDRILRQGFPREWTAQRMLLSAQCSSNNFHDENVASTA